jgi:hypothetical protein
MVAFPAAQGCHVVRVGEVRTVGRPIGFPRCKLCGVEMRAS